MESTATTGVESPQVQSKRLARFCARGVSFGILAYLVGYLLVAALFVFGPANIDQSTHLDVQLKWFGFVFYNAQFVPIAVAGQSYNYITQAADPAVPPLVYQAIPILALGVASIVFSVRSRLEGFVQTVVYSGASVAVGAAYPIVIATVVTGIVAFVRR
ncbi:hypothetical protein [Haladaptatus sp.]|uniref:hypothetical protein n=1 Tax=Haladaptatus sp. TaxID=1973141 RepID=UPI003C6AEE62